MISYRKLFSFITNVLIIIFTLIGTIIMFTHSGNGTGLTSSGIGNFKYFTVLSNEFCGIVAILQLRRDLWGDGKRLTKTKLVAASCVTLTFLVVVCFLAPAYPDLNLYQHANLWFHLIVPLVAIADFLIMKTDGKIPFLATLLAAVPSAVYGYAYLINILLNGVGAWPDTNDWYGFLNWGAFASVAIFMGIVFANWLAAVILRFLSNLTNQRKRKKH